MSKIKSFFRSVFQEFARLFNDTEYRTTIQKEFFYSIHYHWTALRLSVQSKLNVRYLITAAIILVLFILLEILLKPYQNQLIDTIYSYLNPVVATTDEALDSVKTEETKSFGWYTFISLGNSLGIAYLKEYYRSFFSKDAIAIIFSFEMYKYVVITLAKPALGSLIENVQDQFYPLTNTRKRQSLVTLYKRAIVLSLYSFAMQVTLTLVLFPFAPVSSLIISWYFTGVMLMDNYSRSKGLNAEESHQSVWKHKWFAIGTGFTYNALNFIPFVGPVLAPILSSVSSSIGMYELEKEETEKLTAPTAKEEAYVQLEKQTVEFNNDLNAALEIGTAFTFLKINYIKLKEGIALNLVAGISIWIGIFYFLFNFTRTSNMIAFLFPLYKPTFDSSTEVAAAVSFFDSISHFFSIFFVLFLFGFVIYRFIVITFQLSNIYSNSLTLQQKLSPDSTPIEINKASLFINNSITLGIELFLMWATLYLFLMFGGYSLLIGLAVFFIVDAVLVGCLLISSRTSFSKLSFSQKTSVLWQHKGFVLGTGVVYLLASYIPFAGLKYAPSLATTTVELGIQKIKLNQSIGYQRQKNKTPKVA